ncbi:hypothetical protein F2P56_013647 [Juglans regia]|uniref:GH18 domain-containing protein n=2 Tax=Juglans regia TaxID=51240 RepID=A0A834CSH7_JUGRE|nr:class V chitinase-like [Juglans regia]KAF5469584.1 hypothetical protein F2P56_013647 [Juglans regia]
MASSAGHNVVKAGYWFFGSDKRRVADIPSELFTHLYAGFAKVNDNGNVFIPERYLDLFEVFTRTVRVRNPSVKTLLSIGGESEEAHISTVVANEVKRGHLKRDSIGLAKKFGFDGLDLCWLYPSNADREDQLSALLCEWRFALGEDVEKTKRSEPWLLTAAVFHHPVINNFNYPIQAINDNLDWINVLAIDFYTPSNSLNETGPVHAWLTRPMDLLDKCGQRGIQDWIDKLGVATNKLVFSLPFYGYEWIINVDRANGYFGFFAPALDKGINRLPLAFRDIQEELRRDIYETVYDRNYEAVYSHGTINKEKWIGYEDGCSISGKVSKALFDAYKLGGYFAWHLDADDLNWTLSRSAFESSVPPAFEANP